MGLTPEQLEAWLELLQDRGVVEFECPMFRVVFNTDRVPDLAPQEIPEYKPYRQPEQPESMWKHPSLWQGRNPPEFPKKDK